MKHLFRTVIFTLLAGFIVTSCSVVSITKRRYNKGYYVEYRSSKPAHAKATEVAKVTKAKNDASIAPVKIEKVAPAVNKVVAAESHVTAKAEKARITDKKVTAVPAAASSEKPAEIIRHKNNMVKALPRLLPMADAGDDAFSLLWVIVVVILVIYLIGLLLELGPFMHILGIVALVLLILWLLKIV